jgi:hypothetical protein
MIYILYNFNMSEGINSNTYNDCLLSKMDQAERRALDPEKDQKLISYLNNCADGAWDPDEINVFKCPEEGCTCWIYTYDDGGQLEVQEPVGDEVCDYYVDKSYPVD